MGAIVEGFFKGGRALVGGAAALGAWAVGKSAMSAHDQSKNAASGAGAAGGTTTANCASGNCQSDKCRQLNQQIDSAANALQLRLEDLVEDQNDLYNTARGLDDDWGSGSWQGHINWYNKDRKDLKDLIAQADAIGCQVSPFAREIANEMPPQRPFGQ